MKKKRKPRQMTVSRFVSCINERYRQHRSKIINEDIAFGDWLIAQKEKVRASGDLWGRAFKDRRMDFSQATAERYMAIASNPVMRNLRTRRFWPHSFYARYLLATIPESGLQELIDAGRIHLKLTREEAEVLRNQSKRTSPRLVSFGSSINGGVKCDLWHNALDRVFGTRATGRKLAPGAHLYKFVQRRVQSPADIVKAILAQSTLLPDERYWPGDNQPKKWGLLLRSIFEHDKAESILQDLSQMPIEQHEAYIERLMREAYAAHKAKAEATQTPEADADEAA